jgi:Protein of unknown function (DUF1554)
VGTFARRRLVAAALGATLPFGCGLDAAGLAAGSADGGPLSDGSSPVDGYVPDVAQAARDGSDSPVGPFPDAASDSPPALDAGVDAPVTTCSTSCGAQSVCVLGTCTAARRVFVTVESYDGTLAGGVSNADIHCQNDANSASLGGQWKAWVSTGSNEAASRFTQGPAGVGYYLVDGTLLAADSTALTTAALANPIDEDLHGNSVGDINTWTGTNQDGTSSSSDCNDWGTSQNNTQGVIGETASTTSTWSNVGPATCNAKLALFCFEQ